MIVSNSGPLISLARIQRLSLLPELFERVAIPRAVWREVVRPRRIGSAEIRNAEWIEEYELEGEAADRARALSVDAGEAEAIALAIPCAGSARSLPVLSS